MSKLERLFELVEEVAYESGNGEFTVLITPDGSMIAHGTDHDKEFWDKQPSFTTLEEALQWFITESKGEVRP